MTTPTPSTPAPMGAVAERGDLVLEARDITKIYPTPGRGTVHALAEVDVTVRRGRTLGLVGESGSGKTTLTRLMLALESPTSGEIVFEGGSLAALDAEGRRAYRHAVAAVFQNPYSSLDPRMRVWDAITEQQAIERSATKRQRRARAGELLDLVGLGAATANRYPHQLSGGQRQRIAIARAISQDPEVIILDEPLSALDVSVSAQIANLLLDLQERLDVTYVFVGHDLRLVRHLCHDVAVLYRGRIVEQGPTVALLDAPAHPYTEALVTASALHTLAATDDADTKTVPEDGTPGCAYRYRCPLRTARCDEETPAPRQVGDRRLRCHHPLGAVSQ
ncbi:MAG: oligopeptide/dipeptide ABC transporter ATP-binding protein [Acidimicrobiales bacterium]